MTCIGENMKVCTSLGITVTEILQYLVFLMGNLHYKPNFYPGKMNKIFYQSSKEHVKISRIAKFGGEML